MTPETVVDILSLFIRVIIEQIWYQFELYPRESFNKYTFYGFQVNSSRHPGVISYLDEFVKNLKKLMKNGLITRLFLEIFSNKKCKYSFGFSFKNSLLFEQLKNDTQFIDFDYSSNEMFDSFTLINELKSLLYSIINDYSNLSIENSNEVGNFKILISTTDDLQISSNNDWIMEKHNNISDNNSTQNDEFFWNVDLNSFKNVDLGYLKIRSYLAVHKN